MLLYLIEILHQTTTAAFSWLFVCSCILSKFYIKPQRSKGRERVAMGCILSKFYIKPQREFDCNLIVRCCILSKFYIKPQRCSQQSPCCSGCILSKFYIKPQHFRRWFFEQFVVSYRNSTSNHNLGQQGGAIAFVVSYRNSTSNHNPTFKVSMSLKLYLIEILHQTTTMLVVSGVFSSCILSKFYIKPQRVR